MTISDKHHEYAQKVTKTLEKVGIRVHSDLRNEKIGFKIRGHTIARVPYQIIIGDAEVDQVLISVRAAADSQTVVMTLEAFTAQLMAKTTQISTNGGK